MPKNVPRKSFKTEQKTFWTSEFGNDHIGRNQDADRVASDAASFAKILKDTRGVRFVVEFGAKELA